MSHGSICRLDYVMKEGVRAYCVCVCVCVCARARARNRNSSEILVMEWGMR